MKQLTTISAFLFTLFLFSIQIASAQIQVRIGIPRPPVTVVVERPPCPGRDYAWIEGHYVYDSYTRRDVWIPGVWAYIEPRYESRRYEREEHRHHGRRRDYDDRDRRRGGDGRYRD